METKGVCEISLVGNEIVGVVKCEWCRSKYTEKNNFSVGRVDIAVINTIHKTAFLICYLPYVIELFG